MTEEHKIVRPSNIDELVTSENLATIRYWKRHGLTNQEVAKSCGIARSTLQRWATQSPLLKEALKIGKEQAIAVMFPCKALVKSLFSTTAIACSLPIFSASFNKGL